MGERLLCKQEVAGSIPAGSMTGKRWKHADFEMARSGARKLWRRSMAYSMA